jgi:hypothetical protein
VVQIVRVRAKVRVRVRVWVRVRVRVRARGRVERGVLFTASVEPRPRRVRLVRGVVGM